MAQYILTDPNFSEGTDPEIIEAITNCFRNKPGIKLIGYEPDPDFGRLPLEVLGRPKAIREALLEAAGIAYEKIDMEKYTGKHPHIGAVDTIEVYPVKDITIEECIAFAKELGEELFRRYEVPIYYTGENATKPENSGLTFIRKGNYKGAKEDVPNNPARKPDIGPQKLHPTAGATIVGAVKEHDAYFNILLDTEDVSIAKKLASYVRGRTGGFTNIQGAVGLPQTHRRTGKRCVMVSCEVTNPLQLPLHRVFDLVRSEAQRYGVSVICGQVCGTIAAEILVQTAEWYLQLESINGPWNYEQQILENHLLELQN
jgi:glutamate formiminotransferase